MIQNHHYVGLDRLKTSGVLHHACDITDRARLYRSSFDVLFHIAEESLPLAVGLSMHMYALAAIATFPLSVLTPAYHARRRLLSLIASDRSIIVTTGGARTHLTNNRLSASKHSDGYTLRGAGGFMSLAHIADWVLLDAALDDDTTVLCMVRLTGSPCGIVIGRPVFTGTMSDTDTCEVSFSDCFVPSSHVLDGHHATIRPAVNAFQRAWFEILVSAAYLGAAEQCLQEAVLIADSTTSKTGTPVSALDGFRHSIGHHYMQLRAAQSLCDVAGETVAGFDQYVDSSVRQMTDAACLAKYSSTHAAEECVRSLRSYLGMSVLRHAHISSVMTETQYGMVHPMSDFDMEQYFASAFIDAARQRNSNGSSEVLTVIP